MRKLTSFLFLSLDGVVETPNLYLRPDLIADLRPLLNETIAEQDAVVLGRKTYEEWSGFWPDATIEPFATFINTTPKYIMSGTMQTADWAHSEILSGNLHDEITALKRRDGKSIGVHGSICLVQSLLAEGLLDELRCVLCPVISGKGRRLFAHDGAPIQLDVQSAQSTPGGIQYLIFRPRG